MYDFSFFATVAHTSLFAQRSMLESAPSCFYHLFKKTTALAVDELNKMKCSNAKRL